MFNYGSCLKIRICLSIRDLILNDIYHKLGNKPCFRIRNLLGIETNDTCNEECIYIINQGRFGNQFIQLNTAINIARASGFKKLVVPEGFLSLAHSFFYENFLIEIGTSPSKCFKSPFWGVHLYILNNSEIKKFWFDTNINFIKFILRQYPQVYIPNDALVIHIRSGDVFKKGDVNPFYGQPPCSYYVDAIKMFKWSNVILVSENRNNPCVNIIEKMVGNYQIRNFKDDLKIMLSASNLVLSRGTLGTVIVDISRKIQNVFTFNFRRIKKVNTFNCIAKKEYQEFVLKVWKNNKLQRGMMLNSTCEKWEFFAHE